jgi:hypothetical protein
MEKTATALIIRDRFMLCQQLIWFDSKVLN